MCSMHAEKAKKLFLGKHEKKINCAQAVGTVLKEVCEKEDFSIEPFASCGGGKAAGGQCGAYYAAAQFIEQYYPEEIFKFDEKWVKKAGSIVCKDIRAYKKASCLDCVEMGVLLLEPVKKQDIYES